jgi:hypothetical protein
MISDADVVQIWQESNARRTARLPRRIVAYLRQAGMPVIFIKAAGPGIHEKGRMMMLEKNSDLTPTVRPTNPPFGIPDRFGLPIFCVRKAAGPGR